MIKTSKSADIYSSNWMTLTHKEQTEGGSSVTGSFQEDLRQWLTSNSAGDCRDVTQSEHDDNEEDKAKSRAAHVSTASTGFRTID
jgi:hypothetical protein